ncbi:class I SAM-dependent methyltransferase [Kribbella sp. NPDC051770]|uniref:class I SAM-dependent methyltransferase n=1 Tax=Kribbella sp. NPDC051770 TaxID=3155413 RepID=UPI00342DF39F
MNSKTDELRAAHDILAEVYVEAVRGALDRMPTERAMLDLFSDYVLSADLGTDVADIGSGTGRLAPYLAERGLTPYGVDLSPGMIEVARRDYPAFSFEVADLRDLPFADASMAGAVCWFSLIYLAPEDRTPAFTSLARVIAPGGHLVTAYKPGDGQRRRGGAPDLNATYDGYWLSTAEMQHHLTTAGFTILFQATRPADEEIPQEHAYLLARRTNA